MARERERRTGRVSERETDSWKEDERHLKKGIVEWRVIEVKGKSGKVRDRGKGTKGE